MPRHEKFFKRSLRALSSRNRTWEGIVSEGDVEEDASKQRRFQDEVDFRLGAIKQLMKQKERERDTQKSTKQFSIK